MITCTYTIDWALSAADSAGNMTVAPVRCGEEAHWESSANKFCDEHREVVAYNNFPYKLRKIKEEAST